MEQPDIMLDENADEPEVEEQPEQEVEENPQSPADGNAYHFLFIYFLPSRQFFSLFHTSPDIH